MNSFDGIALTGANKTRYLPVYATASGMIGAYRVAAESMCIGQTPLFLLDGDLSVKTLNRAVERLNLKVYVAIYRPFDVKLQKQLTETYRQCLSGGFIRKDGSIPEWVLEDKQKADTMVDEFYLRAVRPYLDYEKAREAYNAAVAAPPVDAATKRNITGDINVFLYERARELFPYGVESVLAGNIKQSAIPKLRFFAEGMDGAPAPKGVKRLGHDDGQVFLLDADRMCIDETILELSCFFERCIDHDGAVKLVEVITHCSEIGLYKGNITLYALGAAFRHLLRDNAVFYDGVCYSRYSEVRDISSYVTQIYDSYEKHRPYRMNEAAAVFFDNTDLSARLRQIFDLEPPNNRCFDTLGMTVVMIGKWIVENLRYPIAFLDDMLYCLYMERALYGEKLRLYDAYFTDERCAWLKSQIPHADTIARQTIKDIVGFDPDTTTHGMSNLPKGHYAPVLYSTEQYIEEILRKSRVIA